MPHQLFSFFGIVNLSELKQGIRASDTKALAKAITLVESERLDHRSEAMRLLSDLKQPDSASMRIGITGIPGVGKSTFIESLGQQAIDAGHRLAVLAIDPSSSRSEGSILGDKTRMESLSRHADVFIRPSPAGRTLGGVAQRTRETMLLCEEAGYDVVFVESVGVGQSETELTHLVDTFLMLAMPGTGDELQGIKRGIMETADVVFVNKSDQHEQQALQTKKQLTMSLHLLPPAPSGLMPEVLAGSALKQVGMDKCWQVLAERHSTMRSSGWLKTQRANQQHHAFERMSEMFIYEFVMKHFGSQEVLQDLRKELGHSLNEFEAVLRLLDHLKHQRSSD